MKNSMKYRSGAGIVLGIVIMIAWSNVRAEKIDGIVAVVDNAIIMNSDLHKKMAELGAPKANRSAEKQVLELMVEDIVIAKVYRSMGLPPVGDNEADAFAKSHNISIETAKSFIMKSNLMEVMVKSRVVITGNMIKNYYMSHDEYHGKTAVRLNQILVKGDEAKVRNALNELHSGGTFEDVAKKYSDVLASGSSDIGWIAIDDLSDEIKSHISNAKTGDIIGPITMSGNSQAVYQFVEKGFSDQKSLDEARDEIADILEKKYRQEAFNHWLQKMMSEYFIGIYI